MEDKITRLFGKDVFNDKVMSERLPAEIYESLKRTIEMGRSLDLTVANAVAEVMKDWAVENGATHYTHWFQPMTGITAEKHDSFVQPLDNGTAMTKFSGKELIKGESDASSFPSGGLRATFEARGYTAWDPTSYAFIKDNVLCIPTAFCSFGGEALDKKTPLLRSMEVVGKQALRILRLFGDEETKRVIPTVGAEQEYFLIRREDYLKRRDLIYTGRTLFGAKPPKGQQLNDHYFGSIKPRVKAFMDDLDEELWRLGVCAKTEHNEAAPAQHELAPLFNTCNIACDHNQLTMDMMKRVASRHGLVCLLHEKPFKGVNGSGKHDNWSLSTDRGQNLFDPGSTPSENAQFLVFLAAVIAAVDDYQDLLRISVATAGNDHRLGAAEAPPAVVSIFLGEELTAVLEAIEKGDIYHEETKSVMKLGVHVLPKFPKDTSDRNRTSPFAFTGNKFEFRMPGSALSIASPNIMLNTAVAEELSLFADELEKAEDFESALNALIRRVITEHKRIIYSGNGYTEEWLKEAAERGLSNYPTVADALPHMCDEKNIKLFENHRLYTEKVAHSRCEIMTENYVTVISIEGNTMIEMIRQEILPAVIEYTEVLARTKLTKEQQNISAKLEATLLGKLCPTSDALWDAAEELEDALAKLKAESDVTKGAEMCRDLVIPAMNKARDYADGLETLVGKKYWPYPTYGDLLFGVN
ncbi:MAG: glutamine synthetase type III [Ruminococcaceae bacterium]|nr:glutamine synthetase type III [Oscillospiraceae bacterium]